MSDCIFCRIVRGEIPAQKVYEDEQVLAFNDIYPLAPVHILVIPKVHIESLAEVGPGQEALMGRLMVAASHVAQQQGCNHGYRSIVNTGRTGGQEVYHLHLHILGGADPLPPMLKR